MVKSGQRHGRARKVFFFLRHGWMGRARLAVGPPMAAAAAIRPDPFSVGCEVRLVREHRKAPHQRGRRGPRFANERSRIRHRPFGSFPFFWWAVFLLFLTHSLPSRGSLTQADECPPSPE